MSAAAIAPSGGQDVSRNSLPVIGASRGAMNDDLGNEGIANHPISPSDVPSPAQQRFGLMGSPSGGFAASRSEGSQQWPHDALRHLPPSDLKNLSASAHKKSRRVLRCLSYPALPTAGTERERRERTARNALARAQRVPDKEKSNKITLDQALAPGPDTEALRVLVTEAARGLAKDGATEACETGGSLEWIEEFFLTRDLDSDTLATMNVGLIAPTFGRGAPSPATPTSGTTPCASMEASPRSGAAGATFGSADMPWVATKEHRAFNKRHWPSLQTFEKYYQPPPELFPPPAMERAHEETELPMGRRSIARIEESVGFGSQAYLWPVLASSASDPGLAATRSRSGANTAGIFEAAAVYKAACKELSVQRIQPPPIFGDRIELYQGKGSGEPNTRQCYALAEAVKASSPQELVLRDGLLTDMGCAKLIESAIMCGRLKHLEISGNALSYRTCTALYTCLRTRSGASLSSLNLAECGLGGDIEDPITEMGARVITAYTRSKAALLVDTSEPAAIDPLEDLIEDQAGDDLGDNEDNASSAGGDVLELRRRTKESVASQVKDHISEGEQSSAEDPTPLLLPLLAQLARPGSGLRRLDLSRTALSYATVTLLGRGLGTTPLEGLILNQCNLDDEALDAISQGLSLNRLLLELKLRGNQFSGDPGPGTALLDAAGRHARLAHLDIAQNALSKECIDDLTAGFRWSCSLVSVHILGWDSPDPDAKAIADACRTWVSANSPDTTQDKVGQSGGGANRFGAMSRTASTGEVDAEDADIDSIGHDLVPEMILCRALHVEGLESWRIVTPAPPRNAAPAPSSSTVEKEEPSLQSFMPNCCWVCNQCAAVQYDWHVPDRGEGDETGVTATRMFVRPSFADFARVELKRQRDAGAKRVHFAACLLVPPGSHCHVFEANIGPITTLMSARTEASVEINDAKIAEPQRDVLDIICHKRHYRGKLNTLARVSADGFQITENVSSEKHEEVATDPWINDPERQVKLRQCYDIDIKQFHLADLCHADEEDEVKETLWQLYPRLYEAYAIFAGRSQWPLVRHVDVYGFFDEALLLDRGGPLAALTMPQSPGSGTPSSPSSPSSPTAGATASGGLCFPAAKDRPLGLTDVQQIIVQTIAHRSEDHGRGRRDSLAKRAAVVHQRTREGAPISRPQFIEVMLRAAIVLRGHDPSTSLAFRRFADRIISGRIMQAPLSPFPRGLPLQVGEVCDTLLSRRKTIREAWERFGGSENAFQRLAQLLKLCDRAFTAKHVASIFALAKRPQCDFKQVKRVGLRYDEFCEAVSRLALIWQRTSRSGSTTPGAIRKWPPQAQFGKPVKQRAVAVRLEAFLIKLAERMKPSFVAT